MSHTILLVQPGVKLDTRTYTDFETISECLEVCSNLIFIFKIHKNIKKFSNAIDYLFLSWYYLSFLSILLHIPIKVLINGIVGCLQDIRGALEEK